MRKIFFIIIGFLLFSCSENTNEDLPDTPDGTEIEETKQNKLYNLVMEYRKQNNLPVIPMSKSLTKVAVTHVLDLHNNQPVKGKCNLHSWSDKGSWTPVCYTSDHKQAQGLWDKPRELTSYKGNGYEISYYSSVDATAEGALKGWKSSSGHNNTILNKGIWKKYDWNAIGVGIYKSYAVIWFGKEKDTE